MSDSRNFMPKSQAWPTAILLNTRACDCAHKGGLTAQQCCYRHREYRLRPGQKEYLRFRVNNNSAYSVILAGVKIVTKSDLFNKEYISGENYNCVTLTNSATLSKTDIKVFYWWVTSDIEVRSWLVFDENFDYVHWFNGFSAGKCR